MTMTQAIIVVLAGTFLAWIYTSLERKREVNHWAVYLLAMLGGLLGAYLGLHTPVLRDVPFLVAVLAASLFLYGYDISLPVQREICSRAAALLRRNNTRARYQLK